MEMKLESILNWYNRNMKKSRIIPLIFSLLAIICFLAGTIKFSSGVQNIDVQFKNGDKAALQLTIPEKAWVGEKITAKVKFQIASPVKATTATLLLKLEIEGTEIEPRGITQITFNPEYLEEVQYTIQPQEKGLLTGSLWVYAGEGDNSPEALLAKSISIKSVSFLGIAPSWWRTMGFGFLLLALFFFFAIPGWKNFQAKAKSIEDEKERAKPR